MMQCKNNIKKIQNTKLYQTNILNIEVTYYYIIYLPFNLKIWEQYLKNYHVLILTN